MSRKQNALRTAQLNANNAASKVSLLTLQLEQAQAEYVAAHNEALRIQGLAQARETEKTRGLNEAERAAHAVFS